MQFIRVDTPFPHEVSQDEEKHGVFEFVPGVDLFPTLGQMAFKFPQLVWLFDPALLSASLLGWLLPTPDAGRGRRLDAQWSSPSVTNADRASSNRRFESAGWP